MGIEIETTRAMSESCVLPGIELGSPGSDALPLGH